MSKNLKLALIPARGGSKRLPKKNIIQIKGKPIIAWTIEEALNSNLFDKVCVSTDSQEIAEIANHYGANVLMRPDRLASDSSKVVDVCEWHLKNFLSNNIIYDELFCLLPTSPMRTANDLIKISEILSTVPDVKAVMAVTNYFYYPFQALIKDTEGFISPFWKELIAKKPNECPEFFVDNGSTYAIKVSNFLKEKTFYLNSGLFPYLMDRLRSIDVDDLEDFKLLKKRMNDT